MDDVNVIEADALAVAQAEYLRAGEVVKTHHREALKHMKRAMVGRCFKAFERLASDPDQAWPIYVAVTGLGDDEQLVGWHFQHTAVGEIQVRADDDLQAGFLAERSVEVPRGEFVAAFNDVLTQVAHFATRIPAP